MYNQSIFTLIKNDMATEPLDDMPKIRLEKDDLESFHRTRAQSTKKSSHKGNLPDETPSTSSSPSWFAILFLLVVIVAAAGYWSAQQYKVLQQSQNRIAELESRLSATGEDMDQSAAALQVKVSELSAKTEDLWSQMDKLWASAWRRNQSEIGDLNKTVMSLKASTEKSTKSLSSETDNNNTSFFLAKEQLENQANLLKQLNDKFGQINNVDADFEQQLASLREKLISTALANNDLTNQIDDLRRRVVAAEKKANEVKVIPVPNIAPL
jgi:cytochrome c-type biogenesis protein CcmH/NrfG